MNIFDKDYKMLKTLENGAKSRTELCDGTNAAYSRLTHLIERGLIISDSWEPVPGQETKFRLSGEGRAYIQDCEDEEKRKNILWFIKDIITPIGLTIITNIIIKLFF